MSDRRFSQPIKPVNCLKVLTRQPPRTANSSVVLYLSSHAMSRAVSTSIIEPLEISKKRFLSAADFLEHPSAILRCADRAALRICWTIANLSSAGKSLVIL
jgi:hypothetical protein